MNYKKFPHEIKLALLMLTLLALKQMADRPVVPNPIRIEPQVYQKVITRFALGEKIYAKNLSQNDLEKVPLVSAAIASEILKAGQKSENLGKNNLEKLQTIKGIGKVKALTINKYLILN